MSRAPATALVLGGLIWIILGSYMIHTGLGIIAAGIIAILIGVVGYSDP